MLTYKLSTTNDLLTSRAGLVCLAELFQTLNFSALVNQHFPQPQSNRGFEPATFVNALIYMLHEGGTCLDDLRYLRQDAGLRTLLGLETLPQSDSVGDWLRRHGQAGVTAVMEVNRTLLQFSLHHCKHVTLDIDATLSASQHKTAEWTYKKCTGYMPMVGHLAETGQVVATDFRAGNVPPAAENLAFIHRCEAALPEGVSVDKFRADAASYQVAILDDCIERGIQFAIRAKMSPSLKTLIAQQTPADWQPLLNRDGQVIEGESTCCLVHTMQDSRYPFSIVVQWKRLTGQLDLDIDSVDSNEVIQCGGYLYRAIAHDRKDLIPSELVHWYNQRGEHSENRIKELKNDFGAARMPCRDFDANALYFALCALAYNLFALLRTCLPTQFERCRAKTLRWRLYALAGKIVQHGRYVYLKVKAIHRHLLDDVLSTLRQLAQAP